MEKCNVLLVVEQGLFSKVLVFMLMIMPKVILRLVAETEPVVDEMYPVIKSPANYNTPQKLGARLRWICRLRR